MKRILALIAAVTLALPLFAQKKNQEPETPRLVENIDVRIINVDVVVTDKRGNFIPNLTADDFTIFENSVQKPITNFYEVQGRVAKNVVGGAPDEPAPAGALLRHAADLRRRRAAPPAADGAARPGAARALIPGVRTRTQD